MIRNIYGLFPDEIELSGDAKLPSYRKQQLLSWLYRQYCSDPDKMLNLPSQLRASLMQRYSFFLPDVNTRLQARDKAIKLRLRLEDDTFVESVLIPEAKKRTLCISSQVGCARACSFCSTGKMKLMRNLETHEIIGQIILASADLKASEAEQPRLTNLVFMGMGEPLDNAENVFTALRIIQHQETLAFSPRRTTLSTCGVIPGIISMADSGIKAKLAVSLNSAIPAKRDLLMPVNKQYPLPELKQALLYFRRKSSFRITLEYVLIPGMNMAAEDLKALKHFVGDISCKLNFIPFNPAPDSEYRAPSPAECEHFMQQAQSLPQAVTLRKSRGADVFGACGQLRNHLKQETSDE